MFSQKLKALLATARIANVPSVVSNVLTGWVLGYLINGLNENSCFGSPVWLAILAGCCLYIGGNFLNDWSDAEWDRKCRPERAIPSGIFSRRLYLGISLLLITVGLVSSILSSMTMSIIYGLIAMFVVSYTLLHKKYGASIWLMGACRAGLYFLGMAVWSDTFKLQYYRHDGVFLLMNILMSFPMIGMLLYIAGISLLARYEAGGKVGSGTKLVAALLLLAPVMTHTCLWVSSDAAFNQSSRNMLILLGAVVFVSWILMAILRSCNVAKKVSFLLAGIALVDSVFLWCGFIYFEGEVYHFYPLIDIQLLYPLVAFFSALLLQKIAPAT